MARSVVKCNNNPLHQQWVGRRGQTKRVKNIFWFENFIYLARMRPALYHLGRHTAYGVEEVADCCVRQSNTRQQYRYWEPEPRLQHKWLLSSSTRFTTLESKRTCRSFCSHAHTNGSDAARDASVKNHYCYRAFTQTLITHHASTDTGFFKTRLQSSELNAACVDSWSGWSVRLPDSLVSERSPCYMKSQASLQILRNRPANL